MWSILSMIFCSIILSENYLDRFQNLVPLGGNGPTRLTSSGRLMAMAATNDAIESRIHKRGEFNICIECENSNQFDSRIYGTKLLELFRYYFL